MSKITPTQRTLKHMRERGYTCQVVEHWNPFARIRQDLYGFIDRDGDGWRERPDGSPLVLRYATASGQTSRQFNELWAKYLRAVGLRITFDIGQWPEQMRKVRGIRICIPTWRQYYPNIVTATLERCSSSTSAIGL